MQQTLKTLALIAIALHSGACATIIEGSNQVVSVSTVDQQAAEVPGAECTLVSPAIGSLKVVTPGSIKLEKSKNDINVTCTKEGYETGRGKIVSHFAAATVGNVLIGGLIGAGIDAASGAANKYDEKIVVVMAKMPGPPQERPGKTVARETRMPPQHDVVQRPAAPPVRPRCKDVGGYEEYRKRTGEVCQL